MLHDLHTELDRRGMTQRIVGAHGAVRDLLRVDGISDKVGGLGRDVTLMGLLGSTATTSSRNQAARYSASQWEIGK
jgi:hypothetical protein